MRFHTPVLAGAGVAAGAVAAVLAFQAGSPVVMSSKVAIPAAAGATSPARAAKVHTVWLPCAKGATLQHRVCVTIEERVIRASYAAAVAPAAAPARPAPRPKVKPAAHPAPVAPHADSSDDGPAPVTAPHDSGDDHPDDQQSEPPETGD